MIDDVGAEETVRGVELAVELDRKYEILYELGRGGMATVYYARDRATGAERAVKVIHAKYVGNAEALARFAREAHFVMQLAHPGIVAIHAVESAEGHALALVMDCVPGRTVKQLLRDHGPLPFSQVRQILDDIAGALGYAHEHGIVHRDVKPENIFVDQTTGRALLSDFGIARSVRDDSRGQTSLTMAGMAIGTPTYMSPEQIDGVVDARGDLYSLGLVGWEMLTGRRPWDGENLYKVIYRQKHDTLQGIETFRPDVPDSLRLAVDGLLEKDPDARWQTAADFQRQLSTDVPVSRGMAQPSVTYGDTGRMTEGTVAFRRPFQHRWAGAGRRTAWGGLAIALMAGGGVAMMRPGVRRSLTSVVGPDAPVPQIHGGGSGGTLARSGWDLPGVFTSAATPTLGTGGYATGRFTVAPGGMHTCLVAPEGNGYCWGDNTQGQIGNGGTNRAAVPVGVAASVPFATIAPGLTHTCAVSRRGDGYCWGNNDHGQLGDGTLIAHDAPERIGLRAPLRAIVTGIAHSCALTRDGRAYCWGSGAHGQLGSSSTADRTAPVPVDPSLRFAAIVAGWNHTCALTGGGIAYCWGANSSGELGDGTTAERTTPTPVHTPLHFVALTGGNAHTCGITAAGTAYCWGENRYGQLGDGTMINRVMPTAVTSSGPDGLFVAIAAGGVHTCAITTHHQAWCWGRNNYGQLGDGSSTNRTLPHKVSGRHHFVTIGAFGAHTCGTTVTDEIFCWGDNLDGQLGDGTREHRSRPVYVEKPNV